MCVEGVGVICAVHHLAAGFLVFGTAAAVCAMGLGAMSISGHSVTCVAHGASLFCSATGNKGQSIMCLSIKQDLSEARKRLEETNRL